MDQFFFERVENCVKEGAEEGCKIFWKTILRKNKLKPNTVRKTQKGEIWELGNVEVSDHISTKKEFTYPSLQLKYTFVSIGCWTKYLGFLYFLLIV